MFAFGDQYRANDILIKEPGKLTLTFTPDNGGATAHYDVFQFKSPGVAIGMYNLDDHVFRSEIAAESGFVPTWNVPGAVNVGRVMFDQNQLAIRKAVPQFQVQSGLRCTGEGTH